MDTFLGELSAGQAQEWLEFFALEPRGEERGDWRAALVAYVTASALSGSKGRTIADFLLRFGGAGGDGRIDLEEGDGWQRLEAAFAAREVKRRADRGGDRGD